MGWTKEQETAIDARGCSLLVSAAAGSGKTSVLVERLVRILSDSENRVPADRMIVVTFTKDAAAEMKQRLTAALADLIEKDPENQWLSEQQLLLQSAKISTVHSFCFDLIRDNIHELELTGSFRILDETEAELMESRLVSEIVTERYETHPEMTGLLYDQFCSRNDTPIEDIIKEIWRFVSSIPYGTSWLESICKGYSSEGNTGRYFKDEYLRYICGAVRNACTLSGECLELAESDDVGEKALDIIRTENDTIKMIYRTLSGNEGTPEERISSYEEPAFAVLRMAKTVTPEAKDSIKALRDGYKKILKEKLVSAKELILCADEDIAVHCRVLEAFTDIIKELEEKLWKKKVEKSCIGFSDAESLAVKLLSVQDENGVPVKSALAKELSEYYKVIMIDEFQDTNNNQDLIFRMLSHGGTAGCPGDDLFMVGDVKQSIYRFRLANPKIFINTMENSEDYSENNGGRNSCIRLNRNFRSSEDVIEFVNFIFRSVMSREVGEIVYDEGEKLIKGAEFSERDRKTVVALTDPDADEPVTQAEYTARKIASMLKDGTPVDDRKGGVRPCTKRDFCILLRRKKDAADYIKALAEYGITAYSEETAGYLSSREISVLLNLLRMTDNPLIDTSLAAVLMSPLFMFTDDEMIILRLEKRTGHLYHALLDIYNGDNTEQIPEEMKRKVIHVMDTVSELRMLAASRSLVELIQYIYERTDFISLVYMLDDGEKKRANLRALLEYARTYQQASDEGLSGFIRYIDRTLEMNGDFKSGQTASTSEDVVAIKTIHKSKGLEYPFVFLCETQAPFNRSDSLKKIQLSFESGIGFRLQKRREFRRYTTLPFELINIRNMRDSVSEEMRLLYVALTRARERLFITLDTGKATVQKLAEYAASAHRAGGITSDLAAKAGCMEDWLLMALITHPDGKKLRELSGKDMFFVSDEKFRVEFEEASAMSEVTGEADTETEEISADPELTVKITGRFASVKQTSVLHEAKFAVSDISKDHEKYGTVLKRPAFMKERTGMTGTERGTAIHSILEHADFRALENDPAGEIKRAAEKGFITARQAEGIDPEYIKAFTSSELFRRAVSSERMERERKFLVRLGDLELNDAAFEKFKDSDSMVQGIVDMYFEEEDGLVLVDYKTDYVTDISELVENYSLQLEIYRAALEKTENKKVKCAVIYSLKLGKYAEIMKR
ncbi:helicase-exonuclease AddAB subunit AddA [Ruminococcus sp. HUN007]|uniref:helicase-exonuclease AddAB subunit AddA n=1 Tax=Ruminococcus sp. HUN007 TaxID=1514668 RepID=UPI0005D2BF5B|nr:helicase-exonuclease AddAB subunit AddA [Ruminococcus sp. HUN007]